MYSSYESRESNIAFPFRVINFVQIASILCALYRVKARLIVHARDNSAACYLYSGFNILG
jgi:hypothetical protein